MRIIKSSLKLIGLQSAYLKLNVFKRYKCNNIIKIIWYFFWYYFLVAKLLFKVRNFNQVLKSFIKYGFKDRNKKIAISCPPDATEIAPLRNKWSTLEKNCWNVVKLAGFKKTFEVKTLNKFKIIFLFVIISTREFLY